MDMLVMCNITAILCNEKEHVHVWKKMSSILKQMFEANFTPRSLFNCSAIQY